MLKFLKKFAPGYWLTSPAAILVLICFFLPWVMSSCLGTFSGWEVVTAPDKLTFGRLIIVAGPLSALLVLILAYRNYRSRRLTWLDGCAPAFLGLLSWSLLDILLSHVRLADCRYGLFGTIGGLIGILLGGLLNLGLKFTASESATEGTENGPPGPGPAG